MKLSQSISTEVNKERKPRSVILLKNIQPIEVSEEDNKACKPDNARRGGQRARTAAAEK